MNWSLDGCQQMAHTTKTSDNRSNYNETAKAIVCKCFYINSQNVILLLFSKAIIMNSKLYNIDSLPEPSHERPLSNQKSIEREFLY